MSRETILKILKHLDKQIEIYKVDHTGKSPNKIIMSWKLLGDISFLAHQGELCAKDCTYSKGSGERQFFYKGISIVRTLEDNQLELI